MMARLSVPESTEVIRHDVHEVQIVTQRINIIGSVNHTFVSGESCPESQFLRAKRFHKLCDQGCEPLLV